MTNPSNPLNHLLKKARQPKAIAIGVTSLTLIAFSNIGFRLFMKQILPHWIEKTLSNALNREVRLGEVQSYSPTKLKIGFSSIPETPAYPHQLTIQSIDAQFNPLFILLQRRLPIKITLSNINAYVKQDPRGNWRIQPIDKIKLPVDLDLSFEIQDADLNLQPWGKAKPLTVEVEGKGKYLDLNKQQQMQYDFTVASLNNQINLKGETLLPTGKTQLELIIQKLALQEIASLTANYLPIQINQGQLNGNVNVQVPSWKKIENSQGQGNIQINHLTAQANVLKNPIKIAANFSLQDTKLVFRTFQFNWSDIQANVQGNLDWKNGLDLGIKIKILNLSNLLNIFSLPLPFSINGNLQTQLKIKGNLTNPVVTGILKNNQDLFLDKIAIKEFLTTFQGNLEQINVKTLKIKPVAGGEIKGKGIIQLKLKNSQKFYWNKIPLQLTFKANLPTQKIIDIYYSIPSGTQIGNIKAQGEITGTLKTPKAFLQWQLPNTSLASGNNIYGTGEFLIENKNITLRNTEFKTAEGKITLTGTGNLDKNSWQTEIIANTFNLTNLINLDRGNIKILGTFNALDITKIRGFADILLKINGATVSLNSQLEKGNIVGFANISQLALNQFFPSLPIPVKIAQTQANFSGSVTQLLTTNKDKFDPFNATANLQLLVDNRPISIKTIINQGTLKADITTKKIALSSLIPNLSLPASLTRSKINLSGKIVSLLSIINSEQEQRSRFAQDIQITADAQLNIANNIIDAKAQLNNNQWQTEIFAFNIPNQSFCPPIEISCPPIDAKIILLGNLDSFLQGSPIIPIQAKTVLLQVEGQNLKANGDIILANLRTKPDASVNLNLEYSSNLKSLLPLDEFISQIPIQQELLLDESSITGKTYFKGRLVGNNLLTEPNPLEKVQLEGNAELTNLSINHRSFEPLMTGRVNIAVQKQVTINLRGKQDVFAFTLERCSQKSCLLPYLPKSFEVLQSYNTQIPAQITGKRQGELLIADLQNFPLQLLRITPIRSLGIPTIVTGNVDADIQFNLFTLAGTGNLNIEKPGIENIQAESFETKLVYNNGLTQLNEANLQIGKNRYQVDGSFDLKTQALQGKLQINQAQIQDILPVINIASLFNPLRKQSSQTTTVEKLQPYSLGNANAPISEQLNQFRASEQKIRQQAVRIESGLVAPILDLQGKFQAEVTLAGTLEKPQVNFQFQGQEWQWFPKAQYLNFVEPIGLVIQESQTIPIEQVSLQGHFENGQIKINYQSEIGTAAIAFDANLVQQNSKWDFQNTTFTVKNLSLDLLRYFFQPPVDLTGEINAQGMLQGNPLNPKIVTNFAFIDGTLNGRPLNIPVEGNLRYANERLTINTTESSPIKISASVPYPVTPKRNDRIELDLKLTTEAIALIDLLTQGQLNWVGGEGEVNLKANGRIDLTEQFKIYNLNSNGQIILNNATFQTPNLPQPLIFNGQLAFNNQYLEVKQLEGNILNSKIAITGLLPLFEPLANNQNPFTITLVDGELNSPGNYQGKVSTNLMITGSAISPIIGGKVRISDGQILLGGFQQQKQIVSPVYQQWAGTITPKQTFIKPPQLNNFQIALDNMELKQNKRLPQYQFNVSGELNLEGNLTNLERLKPKGTIRLKQGKVYILTTDVFLSNQFENTLTFLPEKGLFNPYLNVQLKTFLWDTAIIANTNNEIPDDITKSGRKKSVEITFTIEGQADQLYGGAETVEKACEFQEQRNSPVNPNLVPELSQQLTDCLRVAAFINTQSDLQLLRSPIVEISSSPPLTKNEVNVLFNRQLTGFSDPLQEQNSAQLLEIGIPQIAVTLVPFFQQEIFDVNEWATDQAKSTFGLDRLQIIPAIQTGYKLKNGTLVRISYDYFLDEVTVRYETRW